MLFQSVLKQSKHCIRSLSTFNFLTHAIHSIFLQTGKMLCELHFIGLYLPLSVAQLNNFDSQSTLNCSAFKLNLKHFFQFFVLFGHGTDVIQWYTFSHCQSDCCMWRLSATFQLKLEYDDRTVLCTLYDNEYSSVVPFVQMDFAPFAMEIRK